MFEGWAADLLATSLGRFVDVQRDKLRISLWSGSGVLENVKLRAEAFDYLKLPFAVHEGSVGRLRIKWEEAAALRRDQAAKQADLAAAELAKLSRRMAVQQQQQHHQPQPQHSQQQQQQQQQLQQLAAHRRASAGGAGAGFGGGGASGAAPSGAEPGTSAGPGGGGSGGQERHSSTNSPAGNAGGVGGAQGAGAGGPAAGAGSTGFGGGLWSSAVQFLTHFVLNRLQFTVRNVHIAFRGRQSRASFAAGLALDSISTVPEPKPLKSVLSRLYGAALGRHPYAKLTRHIAVRGLGLYWRVARAGAARQSPAAAASGPLPHPHPEDYILKPLDTLLRITLNGPGAALASASASSHSAQAAGLYHHHHYQHHQPGHGAAGPPHPPPAGLHVEVVAGTEAVQLQVRPEQLQSMAQLSDDLAVWMKRNRYGRFRPPGWYTAAQVQRVGEAAGAGGAGTNAAADTAAAMQRSSSDPGRLQAPTQMDLRIPEEGEDGADELAEWLAMRPSTPQPTAAAEQYRGEHADGAAAAVPSLRREAGLWPPGGGLLPSGSSGPLKLSSSSSLEAGGAAGSGMVGTQPRSGETPSTASHWGTWVRKSGSPHSVATLAPTVDEDAGDSGAGGTQTGPISGAGGVSTAAVPARSAARLSACAPVRWVHVWRYAVRAVLHDVRERRGTWSLRDYLQYKRQYTRIYRRKLEHLRYANSAVGAGSVAAAVTAAAVASVPSLPPPLSPMEMMELQRLEADLPVADILTFRQLAERALEEDDRAAAAAAAGSVTAPSASAVPAAHPQRSWLAWGLSGMSGFFAYGSGAAKASAVQQPLISEAELAELYHMLQGTPLQAVVTGQAQGHSHGAGHGAGHGHGHGHGQHGGDGVSGGHHHHPTPHHHHHGASMPLTLHFRVLRLTLDIRGALERAEGGSAGVAAAPAPPPALLSLQLGSTALQVQSDGAGSTTMRVAVGTIQAFDYCSDPGVVECILWQSDPDPELHPNGDASAPTAPGADASGMSVPGEAGSPAFGSLRGRPRRPTHGSWASLGQLLSGTTRSPGMHPSVSTESLDSDLGHWAMGAHQAPPSTATRTAAAAAAAEPWHSGPPALALTQSSDEDGLIDVRVRPLRLLYRPRCFAAVGVALLADASASLEHHAMHAIAGFATPDARVLAKLQYLGCVAPSQRLHLQIEGLEVVFPVEGPAGGLGPTLGQELSLEPFQLTYILDSQDDDERSGGVSSGGATAAPATSSPAVSNFAILAVAPSRTPFAAASGAAARPACLALLSLDRVEAAPKRDGAEAPGPADAAAAVGDAAMPADGSGGGGGGGGDARGQAGLWGLPRAVAEVELGSLVALLGSDALGDEATVLFWRGARLSYEYGTDDMELAQQLTDGGGAAEAEAEFFSVEGGSSDLDMGDTGPANGGGGGCAAALEAAGESAAEAQAQQERQRRQERWREEERQEQQLWRQQRWQEAHEEMQQAEEEAALEEGQERERVRGWGAGDVSLIVYAAADGAPAPATVHALLEASVQHASLYASRRALLDLLALVHRTREHWSVGAGAARTQRRQRCHHAHGGGSVGSDGGSSAAGGDGGGDPEAAAAADEEYRAALLDPQGLRMAGGSGIAGAVMATTAVRASAAVKAAAIGHPGEAAREAAGDRSGPDGGSAGRLPYPAFMYHYQYRHYHNHQDHAHLPAATAATRGRGGRSRRFSGTTAVGALEAHGAAPADGGGLTERDGDGSPLPAWLGLCCLTLRVGKAAAVVYTDLQVKWGMRLGYDLPLFEAAISPLEAQIKIQGKAELRELDEGMLTESGDSRGDIRVPISAAAAAAGAAASPPAYARHLLPGPSAGQPGAQAAAAVTPKSPLGLAPEATPAAGASTSRAGSDPASGGGGGGSRPASARRSFSLHSFRLTRGAPADGAPSVAAATAAAAADQIAVTGPDGARGKMHGPAFQFFLTASLQLDSYNLEKLGWEPVLEPWELQVLYVTRLTSGTPPPPAASPAGSLGPRHVLSITTGNLLEATLSPGLFPPARAAIQLAEELRAALAASLGEGSATDAISAPAAAPGAGVGVDVGQEAAHGPPTAATPGLAAGRRFAAWELDASPAHADRLGGRLGGGAALPRLWVQNHLGQRANFVGLTRRGRAAAQLEAEASAAAAGGGARFVRPGDLAVVDSVQLADRHFAGRHVANRQLPSPDSYYGVLTGATGSDGSGEDEPTRQPPRGRGAEDYLRRESHNGDRCLYFWLPHGDGALLGPVPYNAPTGSRWYFPLATAGPLPAAVSRTAPWAQPPAVLSVVCEVRPYRLCSRRLELRSNVRLRNDSGLWLEVGGWPKLDPERADTAAAAAFGGDGRGPEGSTGRSSGGGSFGGDVGGGAGDGRARAGAGTMQALPVRLHTLPPGGSTWLSTSLLQQRGSFALAVRSAEPGPAIGGDATNRPTVWSDWSTRLDLSSMLADAASAARGGYGSDDEDDGSVHGGSGAATASSQGVARRLYCALPDGRAAGASASADPASASSACGESAGARHLIAHLASIPAVGAGPGGGASRLPEWELALLSPVVLENDLPSPVRFALKACSGVGGGAVPAAAATATVLPAPEVRVALGALSSTHLHSFPAHRLVGLACRPLGYNWTSSTSVYGAVGGGGGGASMQLDGGGSLFEPLHPGLERSAGGNGSASGGGSGGGGSRRRGGVVPHCEALLPARAATAGLQDLHLVLRTWTHRPSGQVRLQLSCPVWVYNCLGLPLLLRPTALLTPGPQQVAVETADAVAATSWVPPCMSIGGAPTLAPLAGPCTSKLAALRAAAGLLGSSADTAGSCTGAANAAEGGSSSGACAAGATATIHSSGSVRSFRSLGGNTIASSAGSVVGGGGAGGGIAAGGRRGAERPGGVALHGLSLAGLAELSPREPPHLHRKLQPQAPPPGAGIGVAAADGQGHGHGGALTRHPSLDSLPQQRHPGQHVHHTHQHARHAVAGVGVGGGDGGEVASAGTAAKRASTASAASRPQSSSPFGSVDDRSTAGAAASAAGPGGAAAAAGGGAGSLRPCLYGRMPVGAARLELSVLHGGEGEWSEALWPEVDGPPVRFALPCPLPEAEGGLYPGSGGASTAAGYGGGGGAAAGPKRPAGRPELHVVARLVRVAQPRGPEAPGGAPPSVALHVLPRYVVRNGLAAAVQLRQEGTPHAVSLAAGDRRPVQWADGGLPQRLQIRIQDPGWSWSGGVSLNKLDPGDMFVKIRHRNRGETRLVRLDVSVSPAGTMLVSLSHHHADFAPYRIDNCTGEVLHVQQEGCMDQEDVVRPYACLAYTWDEHTAKKSVHLSLPGRRKLGEIELEKVGTVKDVSVVATLTGGHGRKHLRVTVTADGPTRVLKVVDTAVHPPDATQGSASAAMTRGSIAPRGRSGGSAAAAATAAANAADGESWDVEVTAAVAGLALSVVSERAEVLYGVLQGLHGTVLVGPAKVSAVGSLQHARWDNCLRGAVYPIMLYSPHLSVSAAPLAVSLEETHLRELSALATRLMAAATAAATAEEYDDVHGGGGRVLTASDAAAVAAAAAAATASQMVSASSRRTAAPAVVGQNASGGGRVYIEELQIGEIRISVSFAPAPFRAAASDAGGARGSSPRGPAGSSAPLRSGPAAAAAAAAAADGTATGGSGLVGSAMRLAVSLAHVEGAWLLLLPLRLEYALMRQEALAQNVLKHYLACAPREALKLALSMDIFGDVARLLAALGGGAWGLFSRPAGGARRGGMGGAATELRRAVLGMALSVTFAASNSVVKSSRRARAALEPLRPLPLPAPQLLALPPAPAPAAASAPAALGPAAAGAGGSGSGAAAAASRQAAAAGSASGAAGQLVVYGGRALALGGAAGAGADGRAPGGALEGVWAVGHRSTLEGYSTILQRVSSEATRFRPLGTARELLMGGLGALALPSIAALQLVELTASQVRSYVAPRSPAHQPLGGGGGYYGGRSSPGTGGVSWPVRPRVPRFVDPGAPLRRYCWLESMCRLLQAEVRGGAFAGEPYVGGVQVSELAFAVVTRRHLLVVSPRQPHPEPGWRPAHPSDLAPCLVLPLEGLVMASRPSQGQGQGQGGGRGPADGWESAWPGSSGDGGSAAAAAGVGAGGGNGQEGGHVVLIAHMQIRDDAIAAAAAAAPPAGAAGGSSAAATAGSSPSRVPTSPQRWWPLSGRSSSGAGGSQAERVAGWASTGSGTEGPGGPATPVPWGGSTPAASGGGGGGSSRGSSAGSLSALSPPERSALLSVGYRPVGAHRSAGTSPTASSASVANTPVGRREAPAAGGRTRPPPPPPMVAPSAMGPGAADDDEEDEARRLPPPSPWLCVTSLALSMEADAVRLVALLESVRQWYDQQRRGSGCRMIGF
ncbi:hypothetical protein GPECTOR_12g479 [Gonium pectorale]|uniref:Vacuolar protein sorting-associated protein 13 VPS13 adaptor binding domain-containing protein n=1 Tax=Gonium pectorale TaxID=33097 RepID=A0A150GNS9_GONPE|nr:hypothetical protein GPECTOR_12g479 [Gonium pectorale]|eukprot:KXZ51516.1 hypothetical protein GPECTOR_12g479 [Gonium pectorale]